MYIFFMIDWSDYTRDGMAGRERSKERAKYGLGLAQ